MDASEWVRFVNAEAAELAKLDAMPRAVLRATLMERLRERFGAAAALEGRGLVVGERAAPSSAPGAGSPAASAVSALAQEGRLLEVVPEGLTREAAALTGPWLVPCGRALQEGSVLRLSVVVEPGAVEGAPGLAVKVRSLDVSVAVER